MVRPRSAAGALLFQLASLRVVGRWQTAPEQQWHTFPVTHTPATRPAQIAEQGAIDTSGAGFGSTGGHVFGWPKPVPPLINNLFGVSNEAVIITKVPAAQVQQNGLGMLLHEGQVVLKP